MLIWVQGVTSFFLRGSLRCDQATDPINKSTRHLQHSKWIQFAQNKFKDTNSIKHHQTNKQHKPTTEQKNAKNKRINRHTNNQRNKTNLKHPKSTSSTLSEQRQLSWHSKNTPHFLLQNNHHLHDQLLGCFHLWSRRFPPDGWGGSLGACWFFFVAYMGVPYP